MERDSFVIREEPIVLLWRYVEWLNPWIFLNNSERWHNHEFYVNSNNVEIFNGSEFRFVFFCLRSKIVSTFRKLVEFVFLFNLKNAKKLQVVEMRTKSGEKFIVKSSFIEEELISNTDHKKLWKTTFHFSRFHLGEKWNSGTEMHISPG